MSEATRAKKRRAHELAVQGNAHEALEVWQHVVTASPNDIVARQQVAEILARLGRRAEAVGVYEDVARRFAQQGFFFKAAAACRMLLALEPGHQRTIELISTIYTRHAQRRAQAGATRVPPAQPPVQPGPGPLPTLRLPPPQGIATADEDDLPVIEGTPLESGLPSIPLFSSLTEQQLFEVLSGAMEVRAFSAAEVIVHEGAPASSMFALVEGAAEVYRDWSTAQQRNVAHLAPGAIFGEVSLGSGAARLATVVATDDTIVLEFSRDAMAAVTVKYPEVGERLAEFCRDRLLANALRASPLFRVLASAELKAVARAFQPCTFTAGQRLITEGLEVDGVHMLLRGECEVSHHSGRRYAKVREGDLLGEVSLLTKGPATASVTAVGPVLTVRLSGADFDVCVLSNPQAQLAVTKMASERLQRTEQFNEVLRDEDSSDRRV